MFNRQDLDPAGDYAVENTIWPDSVGPYLVFLEAAFDRFTFGGMVDEVAERFFNAFADSVIEGLEIFDGLTGQSDWLH